MTTVTVSWLICKEMIVTNQYLLSHFFIMHQTLLAKNW